MERGTWPAINRLLFAWLQLLNGLLEGDNSSLWQLEHHSDSARERQKLLVDKLVSLSVQTMEKLITGEPGSYSIALMSVKMQYSIAAVDLQLTCTLLSPACNRRTPMLKKVLTQLNVDEGELDCVLCAK